MFLQVKSLAYIEIIMILGAFLFRSFLAPANRGLLGGKEIAIVLITPAAAMFATNIYIFDFYLAAVVSLTSRTRREIFANYLLILPLVPFLSIEIRIGGASFIPMNTLVAINAGALLGFIATKKIKSFHITQFDLYAICLILFQIIIDLRIDVINQTIILREVLYVFLAMFVPFVISSRSILDKKDINIAFSKFIFAGFLCALVTIFQSIRHWVLYEPIYGALHVRPVGLSAEIAIRGGLLRSGGTFIDYTAGGIFMACVLAVLPGMKSIFRPSGLMIVGVLIFAGLIFTQSRGAWIALIFGWLACMAYRGYVMRAVGLAAVLTLVRVTLVPFLASFSANAGAMLGANGHSAETADYRVKLLSEGLQQIASHPLLGQSPAQLRINLVDLTQGEGIVDFVNTHLFIAMASGLVGFAIWFAIWAIPIAMPWFNRPRRISTRYPDPAEMPMAMLVTAMVALAFTSTIDRNLTWPIIALGLMGPFLSLRQRGLVHKKAVVPV